MCHVLLLLSLFSLHSYRGLLFGDIFPPSETIGYAGNLQKDTLGATILLIADTTSVAYLMGQFNPVSHPDFERIDRKYCHRENLFLRKEAYAAFKKMALEALKSGIKLKILSSARNFEHQKNIWERKWVALQKRESIRRLSIVETAREILNYSSMPGTSRHHWGTDIDLNSLDDAYFLSGEGKKVYEWLQSNAAKFGFCQPYASKVTGRMGYEEEKWHWSYSPLSAGFTLAAKNKLKDEMLTGFSGAEAAAQIQMVKTYLLGISADCSAAD